MSIKMYEINGRFGKAEFNITDEKSNREAKTTYGYATYDNDGHFADLLDQSNRFIEGLPKNIDDDDYFKMALLGAIRGSKNATYKVSNELKELNKTMKDLALKLNKMGK